MNTSDYKTGLQSNIWKMYVIYALFSFLLIMPVITLFYQIEIGMSMREIFILQAVFSVSMLFFEIPSGYFADKAGRRISILLGAVFIVFATGIYSVSQSFFQLAVAETLLGVGFGFVSGADSALIYDTLLALNRTDEYKKIEGRMRAFSNFSEGFASIIGGLLAVISLRLPLYIEFFVLSVSIPIAFSLIEPRRHKYEIPESSMKDLKNIVVYSLHENKKIKWLILYFGILSNVTFVMVWFTQPYWKEIGVPLVLFGVLWAALQFSVGIFSLLAHRCESFFGKRNLLALLLFAGCGAYMAMAVFDSVWMALMIFVFYFIRGTHTPLIRAYVNELVDSGRRATVLSVMQFVFRIGFVIIGPLLGWAADLYSLSVALELSAGVFFVCGMFALLHLKKFKVI